MLKEQHLVGLFFTVTGSGKLASTRVCQSLDVRKTTNVQDLFAVSMFPTRQGNAPAGLCLHFFYVHVCVCVCSRLLGLFVATWKREHHRLSVYCTLPLDDPWSLGRLPSLQFSEQPHLPPCFLPRDAFCAAWSSLDPFARANVAVTRLNTQCTDLFLNKNMCSCRMWARILSAISCQLHS